MKKLLIIPILLLSILCNAQFTKGGGLFLKTGSGFLSGAGVGAPSTLLNGLKAYYKLDEASGSVLDAVGDNDGTNSGADPNQTVGGRVGYTFSAADYIDMGNTADLSGLTGAGTLSAWVYQTVNGTTTNYQTIVSKMNFDTERNGYILFISSPNYVRGGGASAAASDFTSGSVGSSNTLNQWQHIVFTWDVSEGEMITYINGSAAQTDTGLAITYVSNVHNFRIGVNGSYGNSFIGTMNHLGVWNRALTSTEITELYDSGAINAYPFN